MFKILVAEDDTELRKLFCTVLEKNSYTAFEASNGEEALEILDKEYIDLIISDIMMPKMDGYTLTQELRDAGYTMPILIVTAKESLEVFSTNVKALSRERTTTWSSLLT